MTTITTQRERELIDGLTALAARRGREEVEIRRQFDAQAADAKGEYEEQRSRTTAAFETEHSQLIAAYRKSRDAVYFECESAGVALLQEEKEYFEQAAEQHAEALDELEVRCNNRGRKARAEFHEQEVVPRNEFLEFKAQCEAQASAILPLVKQAQKTVRRRCEWTDDGQLPPVAPEGLAQQEYLARASATLSRAGEKIVELQIQRAARFLEEGWPVLIFVFLALATVSLSWWLLGAYGWIVVVSVGLFVPLVLALGIRQALKPTVRRQALAVIPTFQQCIAEAKADLNAAIGTAKIDGEQKHMRLKERLAKNLAEASADRDNARAQRIAKYDARNKEAAADFAHRRELLEETHDRKLGEIEQKYPAQIAKVEADFERDTRELSEANRAKVAANRERYEQQCRELASVWSAGLAEFERVLSEMNGYCDARFPAWDDIDPQSWRPGLPSPSSNGSPESGRPVNGELAALRFGRFEFQLTEPSADTSFGAEPKPATASFELPAVLSYPERPSLLLKAEGDGRECAARLLQNVMLRLLTSFPPGKLRFTIIDPVGLGQNFSAFMHLADYDERLVASRIWIESAHINQRLTDLSEHMESVIQKYLRNEFASIQEYNAQAGEVAEVMQILVIANFPANFSEEAARRLVSIAASGARCGVYTLISTDTRLKLPRNFDLADLEASAETLVWDDDQKRFHSQHEDLRPLPLLLEPPPDDERFTAVVRTVGRLAKDATRVEVPFESVTPPVPAWWSGDSRAEIEVPLGRAGAKKMQSLRLGKGTSQHVLISGKTGSGKSTLLNAMITNLALHYSPDELQFYLIDFKKGVEFKAYAAHRLPHARVIAIESEREFGMSALERLDLELKRRGDLFRKQGVQDLKGYRNAVPEAVVPRILLVIDEFQEFFTSDDRISHDAALLLDRLVRQGRAFGIHVLLGSQTLAGAYSLARSTIGQMAVRIALQCSESDAHLILSEDNTAARLLSRPGEAIYNDANGLFEGNHPFQVVWLSDHERESYLQRVADLAKERGVAAQTTIFEGNVAADPAENPLLCELLQAPPLATMPLAPRAWLGAAVAIKDPTEAVFRRQGGSNLLIVGQQEEMALGILANCLVSLAGQFHRLDLRSDPSDLDGPEVHPAFAQFHILDGTRPDAPEAGFWPGLCDELRLETTITKLREAADAVKSIAAEVDRRVASGDQAAPPIFLFVYNLSRFRDLKKSDDFGGFDDDESGGAGKQFATILREGPAHGVHTLLWCDSHANASRWLDRQTMRDLDQRVLFQMSAGDSSNLMDSPAASKLGVHLALYYSEEHGKAEKFRPYGLPSAEWRTWVAERINRTVETTALAPPHPAEPHTR